MHPIEEYGNFSDRFSYTERYIEKIEATAME
jgi:hypothetical protein